VPESRVLSNAPLSDDDVARLKNQIFNAARRMSNDQVLDLADALHDIIRTRQAIRRTHGLERPSFVADG